MDSVLIPLTVACFYPPLTVVGTVFIAELLQLLRLVQFFYYNVTWVILYMCMYIAGTLTFVSYRFVLLFALQCGQSCVV